MPKSKRRLTRRQKIAKGLTRPKTSTYLKKKIAEQQALIEESGPIGREVRGELSAGDPGEEEKS